MQKRLDLTILHFQKLLTEKEFFKILTENVLTKPEKFNPHMINTCLSIVRATLKLGREIDHRYEQQ